MTIAGPSRLLDGLNYLFLVLFGLFCIVPIFMVIAVSVTDEQAIQRNGYSLVPEELSLDAYRTIFTRDRVVGRAYIVSTFVTVVGTVGAVFLTFACGFTLANKQVNYRNSLALFFFIPMVFNAGIVPWYMINITLGLKNNILALIIPILLFNPFNLFLTRNYLSGLPDSLLESAKIDGANDFTIAFRIYFPLAVPVLATITLFYGIRYWNDWWNAIMLVDDSALYPLQYLLFRIQSELRRIEMMMEMGAGAISTEEVPTESLKMATTVITVGPVILLYPLLQRYFIKGLVIGAIKG